MIYFTPLFFVFFSWLRGRDHGWWALPLGLITLSAMMHLVGLSWATAGLVALAWLLWRAPSPRLFGESTTPHGAGELISTALRNALAAGLLVPFWGIWAHALVLVITFISIATGLAAIRSIYRDEGKDIGEYVEATDGLLFGIVVLILTLLVFP